MTPSHTDQIGCALKEETRPNQVTKVKGEPGLMERRCVSIM